jgi:hypothetical protein
MFFYTFLPGTAEDSEAPLGESPDVPVDAECVLRWLPFTRPVPDAVALRHMEVARANVFSVGHETLWSVLDRGPDFMCAL